MCHYFNLFSPWGVKVIYQPSTTRAQILKERPSGCTCFVGEFCFQGKPEFPLSLMNNWCWGTRENLNHSTRFNMFNLKMDFTNKTWTRFWGVGLLSTTEGRDTSSNSFCW